MTIRPNHFDRMLPAGPVVGYRLDGHYDFRSQVSQAGRLRSAGILESRPLTEEQSTRLRALLTAVDSFGGEGMRCFIPGLGFTVGDGSEVVEVVVCLRCYWAYFFRSDVRMVEPLSEGGHRRLGELYVELFPGNDPSAA
jgi:hypothetical protein